MIRWNRWLLIILLCSSLGTLACSFNPFGRFNNNGETSVSTGFTAEEIQKALEVARSDDANLNLPLRLPASTFYRFDLQNEKGAGRLSTILTYDQAQATATYGLDSTARVLMFDAKTRMAGYTFDYFPFAAGLASSSVERVIQAIAPSFADVEFLLRSSTSLGAVPAVVAAVEAEVAGLATPAAGAFQATSLVAAPVDINLLPRFAGLDTPTLTGLIFNDELRVLFTSLQSQDLAHSTYFRSNVAPLANKIRKRESPLINKTIGYTTLVSTASVIVEPIPEMNSTPPQIDYLNGTTVSILYRGNQRFRAMLDSTLETVVAKFEYLEGRDCCEHVNSVNARIWGRLERRCPSIMSRPVLRVSR